MIYLWDTNTAVYYLNGLKSVFLRAMEAGEENNFICEIVKGELIYGASLSKRKKENLEQLKGFFNAMGFLSLKSGCADIYAQMKFDLRKRGKPLSGDLAHNDDNDLWIASVALCHGATVVTNEKGFKHIPDLKVEDWK